MAGDSLAKRIQIMQEVFLQIVQLTYILQGFTRLW